MKKWLFHSLVAGLLISSNGLADGTKFVRSYTAYTLARNEFELEFLYLYRFDKMAGSFSNYKPRLEVEYGILNRLTASFYFNFEGTSTNNKLFNSEPFKLQSNSLEVRCRFSELGEEFIDLALYFEFEYGEGIIGYEPRIIISKRYRMLRAYSMLRWNSKRKGIPEKRLQTLKSQEGRYIS